MLSQVAWKTLWLVAFRAGPQDFPSSPLLVRVLAPLGVLANFLVFRTLQLPPLMALVMAVAAIGALSFVTRGLLNSRKLGNRFQQTFDALLASNALLTVLLLIPLSQVAPFLLEVARDPEILKRQPELLPQGPVWLMNLLNFWNFAVTAHVFRNSVGVNLWAGFLIALIVVLAVMFLMLLAGTFIVAMLA